MRVKLHELRQGSSLATYINDLDTIARHLELTKQQKILFFIFGLKPKLKRTVLIRQTPTCNIAVTFAKGKQHLEDKDFDTQLMDLLQEICKEVTLKHTGIKQKPSSAPVHSTHTNHLQQNLQTPNGYTKSQGRNKSTPYPICCTFIYQPCRSSATFVQDESRNQTITADDTP